MVKKVVVVLVVIAAASIYLTIREQGKDKAFGGALAPLESLQGKYGDADAPLAGIATGAPDPVAGSEQSNYGQLVNRVRTRVNGAMEQSVRRASR